MSSSPLPTARLPRYAKWRVKLGLSSNDATESRDGSRSGKPWAGKMPTTLVVRLRTEDSKSRQLCRPRTYLEQSSYPMALMQRTQTCVRQGLVERYYRPSGKKLETTRRNAVLLASFLACIVLVLTWKGTWNSYWTAPGPAQKPTK